MDPGVRGLRRHKLTLPRRDSSHLELVGQLLWIQGWKWRWQGGTRLAPLGPLLPNGRASTSAGKL